MVKVSRNELVRLQKSLGADSAIGRKFKVTRQWIHYLRKKYGIKHEMLAIRIVSLFGVAVPFSIAISCVSPSKPGELSKPFTTPLDTVESSASYAQLNVGDVRQYVYSDDSSTFLIEIVGKTYRDDGQEVSIETETQGTSAPDTFYEFIRDGYLITTLLDTLDTTKNPGWTYIPSNPFWEELLAETNPKDGDKWIHTRNNESTFYWAARAFDGFTAICSTFTHVFAFDLYDTNRVMLTAYYAMGMDWVGSTTNDSTHFIISCCYMKVDGIEVGVLRPARASTWGHALYKARETTLTKRPVFNNFGQFKRGKQ